MGAGCLELNPYQVFYNINKMFLPRNHSSDSSLAFKDYAKSYVRMAKVKVSKTVTSDLWLDWGDSKEVE